MAKRQETLDIEAALGQMCREKRIYGCKEVTIGFPHQKMGNEICDFVTMDSKGTFRCYEIKVSLSDLQSSAKKSWYGIYNYLVITKELADKVELNKIAARWPAKAVAQFFTFSKKGSDRIIPR